MYKTHTHRHTQPQLHVSEISTEPWTRVFQQVVIYFGLKMRFFLKEKCLLCIKEVDFYMKIFKMPEGLVWKPLLKTISLTWLYAEGENSRSDTLGFTWPMWKGCRAAQQRASYESHAAICPMGFSWRAAISWPYKFSIKQVWDNCSLEARTI